MPGVEPKSWESSRTELELSLRGRRPWVFGGLAMADGVFLQLVGFVEQRERIGHDDDHLAFAMGAKAFLAGVLVFDFERMPVGAFDLNSHARRASPNASRAADGTRTIGTWNQRAASRCPPVPVASCRLASGSVRASGSGSAQRIRLQRSTQDKFGGQVKRRATVTARSHRKARTRVPLPARPIYRVSVGEENGNQDLRRRKDLARLAK